MNLWLDYSKPTTYADDTKTSITAKRIEELIAKLESDATKVLRYMASNGLFANPAKTTLILLNLKNNQPPIQIQIGNETITQENSAKLLGMTMESNCEWQSHISGTGGLIPMLNKRIMVVFIPYERTSPGLAVFI